ncbi:hypothetical protein NN561_018827 [Cricetulus griseus]
MQKCPPAGFREVVRQMRGTGLLTPKLTWNPGRVRAGAGAAGPAVPGGGGVAAQRGATSTRCIPPRWSLQNKTQSLGRSQRPQGFTGPQRSQGRGNLGNRSSSYRLTDLLRSRPRGVLGLPHLSPLPSILAKFSFCLFAPLEGGQEEARLPHSGLERSLVGFVGRHLPPGITENFSPDEGRKGLTALPRLFTSELLVLRVGHRSPPSP